MVFQPNPTSAAGKNLQRPQTHKGPGMRGLGGLGAVRAQKQQKDADEFDDFMDDDIGLKSKNNDPLLSNVKKIKKNAFGEESK